MSHGHGSQDTTFIILGLTVAERLPDIDPKRSERAAPFGTGPWPCRNPLGGHFGELTIDKPVVKLNGGALVARFSCRCGYVYTQRRRPDGSLNKPRMLYFGETLRPFLLNALASGWTAGFAARKAGLETGTLIFQARRMGIETPWVMGKLRKQAATAPSREVANENQIENRANLIIDDRQG